jgi:hypothetical protein
MPLGPTGGSLGATYTEVEDLPARGSGRRARARELVVECGALSSEPFAVAA